MTARAREIGGVCVGRTARSLSRKITQIYEAELTPHGLTAQQFVLLNTIAGSCDDTLSGLAVSAGVDPSTLTRNLQGLEKLGLVEFSSCEEDQRRRIAQLSEAGVRALTAAIPAWETAQQEARRQLGDALCNSMRRADLAL